MENIKSLIETIVKAIVDKPDCVFIEEKIGENTTLYAIKVDQSDLGKVIGKKGVMAEAIRAIVKSVGGKFNRRVHVDITE